MIRFPQCKINLGLSVLLKRPDGYHNLETVFYPLDLCDILEILPSASDTEIIITGSAIPGPMEDNLCFKAWKLMEEEFRIPPVRIHLHKIIPTGAGLGGGSSDAAATLMMLNELFGLKLPPADLIRLAGQLGMDCPFFIHTVPCIGMERGDLLEPIGLDLSGYYLLLVKPEIHVSTAEAYAGVCPSVKAVSIAEIVKTPVEAWRPHLMNDFEPSILSQYPQISAIKSQLYSMGAVYASMSGSGSAVYGLFSSKPDTISGFSGCFVWMKQLREQS